MPTPEQVRRGKPWTRAEDKLLGTMPDRDVAMRLQRTIVAVSTRRSNLGIPKPDAKLRPWSPEDDALLGTLPDMKLARRFKRSYGSVVERRRRLRIPYRNPTFKRWRPEDDHILGTRPDEYIARLLNRRLQSVRQRRNRLGIPNRALDCGSIWKRDFVLSESKTGTKNSPNSVALKGWSISVRSLARLSRHFQHPKPPPASSHSHTVLLQLLRNFLQILLPRRNPPVYFSTHQLGPARSRGKAAQRIAYEPESIRGITWRNQPVG